MHPIISFDLDLTLVDSADGILATFAQVAAEMDHPVDLTAVRSTIGIPLEDTCARFFPPDRAAAAVARYRALYPNHGVPGTKLLPGAAEAVAAVKRHGGRVVVVSAKIESAVRQVLDHVGLEVDAVAGGRFGHGKGQALVDLGATVHVGDHPGDIVGAKAAGAMSVAVSTGPVSAEELRHAGPDVLLHDLLDFPHWLDEYVLTSRLDLLERRLKELQSLVVAFSGGADSAFLLAAAVRALGPDNVLAATAVSPSLPRQELAAAAQFAAGLGINHVTPPTDELAREGYRANAGNRCYFCKAELLDVLTPLADASGIAHIATGTNADDVLAGFRPGIRAAEERGAVTPLRDAALTKAQIREASRRWGLVTWDKPAAACLSSRVAYGIEITSSRLARVERAEMAVRQELAAAGLPVRDLRVRDLGDRARVEVDPSLVEQVAGLPGVVEAVQEAGFKAVDVDPRGFRSGSMNELLRDRERYR